MPMTIDGATRLTGVIGWPIAHSRSPSIHNYWFNLYGINGAYVPLAVAPEKLREAVTGFQAAGFKGLNVTVPHKEAALVLADHVDESARAIGAANVLRFRDDGTIEALNTDHSGFLQALKLGAPDWKPDLGPAVILGAGGAARAVVYALMQSGVKTIRIVNRSQERAMALQTHLGRDLELYRWSDAPQAFAEAALLVNTTTLGLQGQPRLDIPLDALPHAAIINDLVYDPLDTEVLLAARQRNMGTVDGVGMLLHQAASSFAHWFGVDPVIDEALRRHVLDGA